MNPWVEHIKSFAKQNNLSYGCALSNPKCKQSYKGKKSGGKRLPARVTKKNVVF
jgi:hypothetical protein